jgi:Cu+-exporting ATPase
MKTKQLSLRIEGMDCPACVEKIEKSMAKLEGVRSVKVIFSAEKAIITYDTKELNEKEIKRKIKELGYKVSEEGINGKKGVD